MSSPAQSSSCTGNLPFEAGPLSCQLHPIASPPSPPHSPCRKIPSCTAWHEKALELWRCCSLSNLAETWRHRHTCPSGSAICLMNPPGLLPPCSQQPSRATSSLHKPIRALHERPSQHMTSTGHVVPPKHLGTAGGSGNTSCWEQTQSLPQ